LVQKLAVFSMEYVIQSGKSWSGCGLRPSLCKGSKVLTTCVVKQCVNPRLIFTQPSDKNTSPHYQILYTSENKNFTQFITSLNTKEQNIYLYILVNNNFIPYFNEIHEMTDYPFAGTYIYTLLIC